ncbi:hypothetical protein [uncultured Ligilactobacillus sp.]|nr:hypothetical protein [uncultured Ligilactobacillus sp.]
MPKVNLKLIKQRRTELGLTQAMMAKELNLALLVSGRFYYA